MAIKKKESAQIEISEMKMGQIRCHLVGTTPMIMHRFSSKAVGELLMPAPKKNSAERASTLKHDPVAEFRETIYMNRDPKTSTAVHVPTNAFSAAIANAALDVPGATKSQLMRLTSVVDAHIGLYGVPRLFMSMVRSSYMARTPDVRTRAIFPRWACSVTVSYVATLLKENQIANLLATAGVIIGIGDWRSQKGGNYGSFKLVPENDKEFSDIVKREGRKAQLDAIAHPVCFDADTEELLAWFHAEVKRREREKDLSSSVKTPLSKARRGNAERQRRYMTKLKTAAKQNGKTEHLEA